MLAGHEVSRAYDFDWHELSNGALLEKAEEQGFQVVLTVDGNISSQQNLEGRSVSVIVLEASRSSIDFLKPLIPHILEVLPLMKPGQVKVIRPQDEE